MAYNIGRRMEGKVAIVTGGASGIGAETARLLAAHGAAVVACDVQDELGAKIVGEITEAGGTGEYRRLDVTSEAEWRALVSDVERKYGRLTTLGNIAGISGRPAGM